MDREAMGDEERATRLEVGRDVLGIDRAVAHVRREQGDQSGFLRCLGRRDDAKAVRLRLALGPAAGPGADDHVEAAVPQVAGMGASLDAIAADVATGRAPWRDRVCQYV